MNPKQLEDEKDMEDLLLGAYARMKEVKAEKKRAKAAQEKPNKDEGERHYKPKPFVDKNPFDETRIVLKADLNSDGIWAVD